jgi:hypothetical protein
MKHNKPSSLLSGAAVLVLALMLAGCGGSPLVGKWENMDVEMAVTIEFQGNGSFTVSSFGISVNGRYTVSGGTVTMTLDAAAAGLPIGSGTSAFSINGSKLTLDGIVFTRK